jgi:hypothetical protein
MVEDDETIERHFNCRVCGSSHRVKLNKKLLEGRSKFPFPYLYLHNDISSNDEILIRRNRYIKN